jgi:heptosyltransferase-1
MRILLIKTSSLGDVVHNLPVVSDLHGRFPDVRIDWVVEEGLADIVRLHPAVGRVIPVAVRRWRKALLKAVTWREVRVFRTALREEHYDLVLDTQGLLKSALITRMAQGKRCGYSSASAREPVAARFYDATFDVPKDLHAVIRNRRLSALAGGYSLTSAVAYGITAPAAPPPDTRSAMLLTATSRDDKLWPEQNWIALGKALHQRGLACLLPSGNTVERERAVRLANAIPGSKALPPSDLHELAGLLGGARLVIGVDTGLVHLAAALGRPTVAMFRASDPALTGVLASTPAFNLGTRGAPPSVDDVLAAAQPFL